MKKARSYRIFATFLLLLFFVSPSSTWALTTFGKTNPQIQNQSPPPPTPGFIALGNHGTIRNVQFQVISIYSNLRMISMNSIAALHTPCNSDSECIHGAYCVQANSTTAPGKRCYCHEGYYEESPLLCSGSASIFTLHATILLTLSIVKRNFCFL
ncbi:uncharacterized protein LOC108624221 [Ceratina calcarata]|uniref:Uncharacterized protein LOC108624221 n=1 Tax=Ceratina calcarata TaxID=156304 RepID=A0AAJ7S0N5_9HYME|nr:uncharacterized protein LOC108624221 [Ceratina calcarata]